MPNPTDRTLQVQFACHLEEISEMADGVSGFDFDAEDLRRHSDALKYRDTWIGVTNRTALLDSLCDQIVTAIGVAHMLGMNIEGALAEVNRSNWSKFVESRPMFDANGKIIKGPDYRPPELGAFV